MAFETGTADDHKDLLAKLRTFILANGWTENRYTTDPDGEDELHVQSTGVGGSEQICIGYLTVSGAPSYSNIRVMTAPAYNASDFDNQPARSPNRVLHAWHNPMPYWFIVSPEHIMVIVNVSSTWHSCYNGKIEIFCSLGHWPTPFVSVATSNNSTGLWSGQGNDYSSLQKYYSGNSAATIYWDGSWSTVNNMWPAQAPATDDRWQFTTNYPDGDVPAQKSVINHPSLGWIGSYHNVYHVNGLGWGSGTILDDPAGTGADMIMVENVYRTGTEDYYAVELS